MYKNLIGNRAAKARLAATLMLSAVVARAPAQLSLAGQLRDRAEIRNGFGNLLPDDSSPASFVSQRTRLLFTYKLEHLTFGATLQDVRVWGQDASSISAADGNRLMLHEGWAEITLADRADTSFHFKLLDRLSFKIGRQELSYDDARLLGNLDWLQQGRRFDMALLKALHKGWQAEVGYAYNQNSENFSGNAYTPGNVPQSVKNDLGVLVPTPAGMVPLLNSSGNSSASGNPSYTNPPNTNGGNQQYKQFLSVYLARKINQTRVSFLFFKDDFAKYRAGSVAAGGGVVYGRFFDVKGSFARYTSGAMITSTIGKTPGRGNISWQAGGYVQSGKDRDGKELNATHYTLSAMYNRGRISIGPGYDALSGNKSNTPVSKNKRFDPLYGTPHKFWGTMDYFYAGTGSPENGLSNYYLKSKFTSGRLFATADLHRFYLANPLAGSSAKKLGSELDLAINYTLNKFTSVEAGYSVMKGTSLLPLSKGQPSTTSFNKTGQWSYLMINIRPDFTTLKSKS